MIDTKIIAKRAKAKAFNTNLEAFTLFNILANVGGNFGLLTRQQINCFSEIEEASKEESYSFLNWLPGRLKNEFIKLAEENLIKASFITNQNDEYKMAWNIVADQTTRTRIQTKARKWAKSRLGKKWMDKKEKKSDSVTTIHFV